MERADGLKARQMKAARALLDWSQEDLARISHLSIATIRKLELGYISPRGKTVSCIRHAFEDAGLEFIEPDGVRHRPEDVTTYQGHDGVISFFDDVYQTVSKKGGDVVVVCPDEVQFTDALAEYQHTHFPRMVALSDRVAVRCILTENNQHMPAKYCEYRWISKHYVDSVPFYVYGDKYAIIVFESDPSPKITVIQSRIVAAAFRHQFYSMWEKSTLLSPMESEMASIADNRRRQAANG